MQEMDYALAQTWEDHKTSCQQVVCDTAKASLGKHDKKHQDWFDPNDQMQRNLVVNGTNPTIECYRSKTKDPLSKLTRMPAKYYRNTHELESNCVK